MASLRPSEAGGATMPAGPVCAHWVPVPLHPALPPVLLQSGQHEAILNQLKPSYAPVMFQLHETHVIIKLHHDQTSLSKFTFPSVVVHHFPPLPLKTHWTPWTSPITQSPHGWALTELVALHSASSRPLSPLPTPSAPGFSPSHTSTALSP